MSFEYYSPISINAAQVPSTQTDFPVLVSQTDARFKTVANNGHVRHASGFDIRPYSDAGLTTPITGYELERYNASSGEVIMWVKIGSLSSSTTPIYLAYGDSSISTDGSSATTWSNSFRGVWHLKDGSTLSLADSAGGSFTLTNNAVVTAATGNIDGAAGFVDTSSQFLSNATIGIGTAVTFSCWFNPTTFAQSNAGLMCMRGATGYCLINLTNGGAISVEVKATADVTVSQFATATAAVWNYIVLTYDLSAGLYGYLNAVASTNGAANGNLNTDPTTINIGRDSFGTRYSNGAIDEPRIANVARSANWITTEYNNQFAPGTFETLGAEVAVTNSGLFRL